MTRHEAVRRAKTVEICEEKKKEGEEEGEEGRLKRRKQHGAHSRRISQPIIAYKDISLRKYKKIHQTLCLLAALLALRGSGPTSCT